MWELYSCVASCLHLSMSSSLSCHVLAVTNLSKLAAILEVLPVTTVTVERTFSSMKLMKARLRSRMGVKHTGTYHAHLHWRPWPTVQWYTGAVVDHYKTQTGFMNFEILDVLLQFCCSVQITLLVWVKFCVIDGRRLVGPAISLHHAMGIRICRLHKIAWCLAPRTKSRTSYTGSFLAGATLQCMVY